MFCAFQIVANKTKCGENLWRLAIENVMTMRFEYCKRFYDDFPGQPKTERDDGKVCPSIIFLQIIALSTCETRRDETETKVGPGSI